MVSSVWGQGLLGQGSFGLRQDAFSSGPQSWSPFVKVGLQGIRLNFSVDHGEDDEDITSIGLKVRDTLLVAGSVGFDTHLGPGFIFTLVGAGNALRVFDAETNPDIIWRPASGLPEGTVHWNGTKLQWWAVDGSLAYRCCKGVSAVFGLRWDRLSFSLKKPSFNGLLIDPEANQPVGEDLIYRYRADFQAIEWVPYFGLQFQGTYWKARLLGTPIAYSRVSSPFRYLEVDDANQADEEWELKENRYWVDSRCVFLEGTLEYWFPTLFERLDLGLWVNASCLKVKDLGAKNTATATSNDYERARNTANYTKTLYGLGGSVSLAF